MVRFEIVRSEVEGELGGLFLWQIELFEVFSEDLGETAFHKIICVIIKSITKSVPHYYNYAELFVCLLS